MKASTYINSFTSSNDPIIPILIIPIFPFYRGSIGGSERLNNLSKVTQRVNGVAGILTQFRFQVHIVYYYGIQENKHVNKEMRECLGADNEKDY